jgi:hypothetical protein
MPDELQALQAAHNAQFAAYAQLRSHLSARLAEWEAQFNRWLRAPYGQRGRNLRPVSPRGSVARRAYGGA